MQNISATMLAAFGLPPRGVSFYCDQLAAALGQIPDVDLGILDYVSLYPSFLRPAASGDGVRLPENAIVRWNSPASWRQAAMLSAPVMHMQYWTFLSAHYLVAITRHLHRQGKKCVVTVHNPNPHETIPVAGYMERRLLRLADRLIVHSESGREILIRRDPGLEGKIRVIPHGIVEEQAQVPGSVDYRTAGLDPARRYILIFGNLRGYKGVPTLLRAWKRVIGKEQDTDLIIAGRLWNKTDTIASRLTARLLGSSRVAGEIAGLLDDDALGKRVVFRNEFLPDNVIDAMCRLAVLAVFPYDRFSGQSGAATRAAGWGLPLIVSRVGALPELAISDDYVCAAGDVDGLAGKLEHLLSGPDSLAGLRQEQRAAIRPYRWDSVAARNADVYRELSGPHDE